MSHLFLLQALLVPAIDFGQQEELDDLFQKAGGLIVRDMRGVVRKASLAEVEKPRDLLKKLLPHAGNLEVLDLGRSGATDWDMDLLVELQHLRELNISDTPIGSKGIRCVAAIKGLKVLGAAGLKLNGDDVAAFVTMRDLKTLLLARTNLDDTRLRALSKSRITHLSLGGTRVTEDGLAAICRFEKLESLSIIFFEFTERGISNLSQSDSLIDLDLRECVFKQAETDAIKLLKSIRRLNLAGATLTESQIKALSSCKSLRSLDLGATKCADDCILSLASLQDLHELWINSTKVTDKSIANLGKLKALKLLDVSNSNITEKGVLNLQKSLPRCEVISPLVANK